jgi:hypothetical protein
MAGDGYPLLAFESEISGVSVRMKYASTGYRTVFVR